jgi:hypothetical protein
MQHRTYNVGRIVGPLMGLVLGLACATPPEADPQSATVWGYVRLVPRTGTPPTGGGYGDRRLASARRVDYSHTKYAVVFVPTAPTPALAPLELTIRDALTGPRIEPGVDSSTLSSGIRITNASASERFVSIPEAGWLERLAPGSSALVQGLGEGESTVHLLGLPNRRTPRPAQIWISTGIKAEVEASGRYTIRGLGPGPHRLQAWHPRLPPTTARTAELSQGTVQRIDIEIGVDSVDSRRGDAR